MQQRKLGKTTLDISEIGFGGWAIGGSWGAQDDQDSLKALHKAIDNGVNFIDTAAGYGDGKSEQLIGKVLQERSETIYVATKTPPMPGPWPPSPYCKCEDRYSEKYLRSNIEERLKYLGTDCIDVLQLHSWTRAWNRDPQPLLCLQKMKQEGKIRSIGISTPEHDQNCAVQLMKDGLIDTLQIIFNLFEQEPAAEILPVAKEMNVGVIVRVALDEGVLSGKYKSGHQFPEGDFRRNYFAGDRLDRSVQRVTAIKKEIEGSGYTMAEFALKWVLQHDAVSCVIPGMRNVDQAEKNTAVSRLPKIPDALMSKSRDWRWNRAFWYSGK